MKSLGDFSVEELEAELERRKQDRLPPSMTVKSARNWDHVVLAVQKITNIAASGDLDDDELADHKQFVFEKVIDVLYDSEAYWEWRDRVCNRI